MPLDEILVSMNEGPFGGSTWRPTCSVDVNVEVSLLQDKKICDLGRNKKTPPILTAIAAAGRFTDFALEQSDAAHGRYADSNPHRPPARGRGACLSTCSDVPAERISPEITRDI